MNTRPNAVELPPPAAQPRPPRSPAGASDARLASALREEDWSFLELLRALNALDQGNPARRGEILERIAQLNRDRDRLAVARELALVADGEGGPPALTSLGKRVCDGVKQYCNWRAHRDALPRGVTERMVRGREILDVGCGVGCALLTFARFGASRLVGVDLSETFRFLAPIFAAREGLPPPDILVADAADLPLPDASFDLVFCRLALNYMRADAALREMARVARDGADLVVCLNLLSWDARMLLQDVRGLRLRSVAFQLLRMLNGMLYHTARRQVTLRVRGGIHSVHSPVFFTLGTLRRELRRWQFRVLGDDARRYADTPAVHARRRPRHGRS